MAPLQRSLSLKNMRSKLLALIAALAAFTSLADTTQDSSISSLGTGIHLFSNNLLDDYGRLMFGSTTSNYPALKRSGATLQMRTANDASYADFKLRTLLVDTTKTAGGTTSTQTINKGSGSVNIAASGTSCIVSNSLCTTSSYVIATLQTADATGYVKNVVPGAGFFTITTATNTAEVAIAWLIINP